MTMVIGLGLAVIVAVLVYQLFMLDGIRLVFRILGAAILVAGGLGIYYWVVAIVRGATLV